jgi:hypothetical protein
LLKEIVLQQGGVVPSITLELLLQKQSTLPLDVATSIHQQSLEISDRKVVVAEPPTLPSLVVDSRSLPAVTDAPVSVVG